MMLLTPGHEYSSGLSFIGKEKAMPSRGFHIYCDYWHFAVFF